MKPAEIYALLTIRGVSVEEIATTAQTSTATVYRAIRGERSGPEAERALEVLAGSLRVPLEDLGEVAA